MMPAEQLLPLCNEHLVTEHMWRINGTHYARTLRGWLKKIDQNRKAAHAILERDLEKQNARLQFGRWRIFFMACEELFGFNGGNEWYVGHYRLKKR
jgi:cyclopropane-fatty-acyl-phospholipid synthase